MLETVNVNLDRGYDSAKSRALIAELGFTAEIARKGVPAPIQAGKRWVVERLHSWMNDYGKLRRYTERSGEVVNFYLYLAATLVTLRMLIGRVATAIAGTAVPPHAASSDPSAVRPYLSAVPGFLLMDS